MVGRVSLGWLLRVCSLGETVWIDLTREVTGGGLVVEVVGAEGVGGIAGLEMVPVQVSIHGGEGEQS